MCASFGQLFHSSWEIPVLFSVITVVTEVQIDDDGCDLTKTDVDRSLCKRKLEGYTQLRRHISRVSGTCFPF